MANPAAAYPAEPHGESGLPHSIPLSRLAAALGSAVDGMGCAQDTNNKVVTFTLPGGATLTVVVKGDAASIAGIKVSVNDIELL
jgi:hypothetical protein